MFSHLHVGVLVAAFLISHQCYGKPVYSSHTIRNSPVTEELYKSGQDWVSEVTLGGLDKKFRFLVDTGSCWTWIKKERLDGHSMGTDSGEFVVNYAIGIVTGKKYESQIAVGNGHLVIKNQVIGVADRYDPLTQEAPWDGILGLSLSSSCDSIQAPPTILRNLADQGQNGLGISFAPSSVSAGQLIWGEPNKNLTFVPALTSLYSEHSEHWTIMTNIVFPDGIRYAGLEMELDTGSSEILLDEVTYEAFTDLIDGPVTKLAGMTGIPLQAYNEEDTLTIEIGGEPYTLAMGSLRSTGVPPGGDMNLIWLRVDEDMRSILGAPFFKEYYVHFDEANERVGVGRNI